ncbi:MAG: EI24 domain-containing protein [bacterium]|nr:EI24 domain-containing protein [bacterium]
MPPPTSPRNRPVAAPAARRNAAAEFLRGVGDVWRGFAFLTGHPRLWPWAIIPFLLNIALFALLTAVGWHYADAWLDKVFFATSSAWFAILGGVLAVLIWIVFLAAVVFLFVPLAALVAAPFNDVLSEKVERLYAGASVDEAFSLRALGRGIVVGLGSSLRLATLTLVLLAAALALNLIPSIGPPLAAAASAAVTIRFLVLEFTSYSMERRVYDWRGRRDFLRRNRARTIGLGCMAFVLMLVPVVNALFIPVSAVAGTLLFCDTELDGRR